MTIKPSNIDWEQVKKEKGLSAYLTAQRARKQPYATTNIMAMINTIIERGYTIAEEVGDYLRLRCEDKSVVGLGEFMLFSEIEIKYAKLVLEIIKP